MTVAAQLSRVSGAPPPGLQGLVAYLAALAGEAPAGQLIELRYRVPAGGMGQRFFDVARPDAAAAAITALAREHDVYIGPAPRSRRAGTRDAVAPGWTLWADCDDEPSLARLETVVPQPAILVRSGSGNNRHAYWPLTTAVAPAELEQANRRLAAALGSDMAVSHLAAILRPPSSLNLKHDPPTPVTLERLTGQRFEIAELLRGLPEIKRIQPCPSGRCTRTTDDPLLAIEPAAYVAALTGQTPGRDGKINCPLHEDRTPSLHVYKTPEQGWYCYGCRTGGSVYDLAAALVQCRTRGEDFVELRRKLECLLSRR